MKSNIEIDDRSSNVVSFDASKRSRDDRLNKVMNQFSSKAGDNDDWRKPNKNSGRSNKYEEEIDDDDDIVSMMDKMNRK